MKKFKITFIDNQVWKGKEITIFGDNLRDALLKDGWGDDHVYNCIATVEEELCA